MRPTRSALKGVSISESSPAPSLFGGNTRPEYSNTVTATPPTSIHDRLASLIRKKKPIPGVRKKVVNRGKLNKYPDLRFDSEVGETAMFLIEEEKKRNLMEFPKNNVASVAMTSDAYRPDQLQMLQFRADTSERGFMDMFWLETNIDVDMLAANLENIIRDYLGEEPQYAEATGDTIMAVPGEAIIRISREDDRETEGYYQYNVWVSADFALFSLISDYVKGIKVERPRKEGVYTLTIRYYNVDPMQGLQARRFRMTTTDFEDTHGELYPYIDSDVFIDLYSESKESIVILQGEPGTGKTSLVKLIMREMAKRNKQDLEIAYIKDRKVLMRNDFWINMTDANYDLMVLDDLDEELLPRTENDDNTIVNNLLSFSDGIFQSDTKILVTTNLSTSRIDPALVRPGRCFDALRAIPLSVSQARDLWVGFYEMEAEQFDRSFAREVEKGEVTQARLVSEVLRIRAMGEAPYLLDQRISVRKEYIEQG